MRSDERAGGRKPPVVSIDHRSLAAPDHLLICLTWPNDKGQQRQALFLGPVSPWVLFHLLGMADRDRLRVLADAQREVLVPLIEACSPPQ